MSPLGSGLGLDMSTFASQLDYLRQNFLVQLLGPGFFEIGSIIMFGFLASIVVRVFNWLRHQF